MSKRVLIFANPIAGRGKGRGFADRIARRLSRDGLTVQLFRELPEKIADVKDVQAVITIGGDGTLRAAAERLMQFPKIPPLLVVPLGTANLMARHLGINWTDEKIEDQIAAAIANRKTVSLDAARANERLFLLMAGVGLDASVVHEMDRIRTGAINFASYAMPIFSAVTQYDYPRLQVEIDGKTVLRNKRAIAFVGNVPEYGTGFPILTNAKSDDGLLDVCVLPCKSPTDLLRLAMLAAAGEHLHEEGMIYARGKSIRIDSPQPVPVQIDGDAAGHTPLNIELLPTRLKFIVPSN